MTKKGYGYKHAENDPVKYHAVSPGFYQQTPKTTRVAGALTYTEVFSRWLCDAATREPQLVGITPAMKEGSGLVEFAKLYPQRYFDVGIAEQHAVTLAAGMACAQLRPVVAIYSSFLLRAYDQLIHDVALQNLPVLFAIDRAGLVGADGATHTGSFDISFVRCIPNVVIMTPANENECYHMLDFGFALKQPVLVRYPRGKGSGVNIQTQVDPPVELGKGVIIKQTKTRHKKDGVEKKRLLLLNFGTLLPFAEPLPQQLQADNIDTTLVDMRFVKPLDTALLRLHAPQHDYVFTLEDNTICGGAGSAVNEFLIQIHYQGHIKNHGLPDGFPPHATQTQLYRQYQLDTQGLLDTIRNWILYG